MYAKRLIEAKIAAFRNQHGWEPQYHTIAEVKSFTEYIASITTESNRTSKSVMIDLKRPITKSRFDEIKHWIQNEQILCNPPEAPIWMGDYTFKPLGEIKIGDRVIGWERELRPQGKNKSKSSNFERMKRATVLEIYRRRAPILKVTMESGRVIRCTKDHLWSNGATYRSEIPWINVKIGRTLRRIVDVYPNEPPDLRQAAWLGGLYDGEGSAGNSGISLSQSRDANPIIHTAIENTLQALGFQYGLSRGDNFGRTGLGRRADSFYINGGKTANARFAAWCRPYKIDNFDKLILKNLEGKSDRIVDIQYDGEDEVISMKTSTGNYVAWGYASKNCTVDEGYWSTRYAFICDEKGEIFQFTPRVSQQVFDAVVAHFEDLEVAIELFVLKARQLGLSTRTALKFLHRMLFISNTQAVMASVQAEKSELIGRILNIAYQRCPWWLVPQRTVERAGRMSEWTNGSVLSIQSGMQATGIAQGWTPTAIHISEVGDIPNPKKVIEEGLLRATHPTRKLFQVYEGTGNGNTGWQADYWRAIKEDFPRGRARLCPLFLSWPLATDLYPEADWLKKFPIPEDWYPCEETRKHVRRCELYIRTTPHLSNICGTNYEMPRHQQWFWEFNYLAAVKTRTQRIWLSQMPADDFEALTGKNDLVFDPEMIQVRTNERERNYQAYAIVGGQIDEGFEPAEHQVDYDAERIVVEWESNRGTHYSWTLIPLLPFDDQNELETFDKLLVFEPPKEGREYTIGIDTADGLNKEDEDRAVCNVTLSAKGNYPDVQVAELSSIRINPPQMVGFAACLGAWYGKKCRDARGAKFVIEQRMKPGDDCQLQLKLMGFNWQHRMMRYDDKKIDPNHGTKEGWYSNTWSVPFMTHRFVDAIKNGWYKPNSPWFIRELGDYERKVAAGGKTKLEHQQGKHDDRIRAAAMAYISRHQLDVLQDRTTKVYSVKSGRLPELNLNYAQTNTLSVGD